MYEQRISNPSRAKYRRKPSALFVPPLLPTLVDEPPEGSQWQHELKYDGYRTLIVVDYGKGRAFAHNRFNWTDKYTPIVGEALRLGCKSAAIDGEVIVQDERGFPDFDALRATIEGEPHRLVFMASDLLELNVEDLRPEPLTRRKELLLRLIGEHDPARAIQYVETIGETGAKALELAYLHEIEGLVSKKVRSTYQSGRQRTWLKTKCYDEGDFLVIGAEREPGKPPFGLLARETADGLEYAGSAFVSLGGDERDRFWETIEANKIAKPAIPMSRRKFASWTKPTLRVRAQHVRAPGKLRHATIREIL